MFHRLGNLIQQRDVVEEMTKFFSRTDTHTRQTVHWLMLIKEIHKQLQVRERVSYAKRLDRALTMHSICRMLRSVRQSNSAVQWLSRSTINFAKH